MIPTKKLFVTNPQFFLLMGADIYHEARLGPLTIGEVLSLLTLYSTPEAAYRANRPDGPFADRFGEAIYDLNSMYADEDGHDSVGDHWRWLGLAMRAEGVPVSVWVHAMAEGPDRTICQVTIDAAAIEGQARTCALAALEALQPLLATEGAK